MAMTPERSRPLHNFSLPHLQWGSQRFLRCMKVASGGRSLPPMRRSPALDPNPGSSEPTSGSPSRNDDKDEKQIEAIREKLTFDLRVAAEKMRVSVLDESTAARPWNLRTRRAACTGPVKGKCNKPAPLKGEGSRGEKNERAEFSIALSREEIEDDFAAIAGRRPARRPKKRPRIVQRQLDAIFPGLWLTEVTEDSYRVEELPESGTGKV